MRRLVPFGIAALLVSSLVVAGVAFGDRSVTRAPVSQESDPTTVEDSANRLPLEPPVTDGQAVGGPNFGATLAGMDDAIRTDRTLYDELGAGFLATTAEERATRLESAYEIITGEIDALRESEEAAAADHREGASTTAALLHRYQRNYAYADYLDDGLTAIEDRIHLAPDAPVSATAVGDNRVLLEMHRTTVGATLAGSPADTRHDVHLQTSATGYSLSVIDGETWHLETTRFDNRAASAPSQFDGISDAFAHTVSLYPWVSDQPASQGITERATINLYDVNMPHDQGQLEAFLDAGTGGIYREYHTLSLPALPSTRVAGPTTDEGLRLSVNETPAGGPLSVTVTDAATGEPVPATVEVDGAPVTETDETGVGWLVTRESGATITATAEGGSTVSVTLPG